MVPLGSPLHSLVVSKPRTPVRDAPRRLNCTSTLQQAPPFTNFRKPTQDPRGSHLSILQPTLPKLQRNTQGFQNESESRHNNPHLPCRKPTRNLPTPTTNPPASKCVAAWRWSNLLNLGALMRHSSAKTLFDSLSALYPRSSTSIHIADVVRGFLNLLYVRAFGPNGLLYFSTRFGSSML